jgi:hypothetical protein
MAAAGVLALAGCNRYSIENVQIRNAPGLKGSDRMVVCDTCQQHSGCGTAADSTVWATDHYQSTKHHTFTREACHGFGENLSLGVRGNQPRAQPTLQEQRVAADGVLTKGMGLNDARMAMRQAGVEEKEADGFKTVRFQQTISDGQKTLTRDVWGDFSSDLFRLLAVRYGPWQE